ncbi:MAG: hypothetical protein QG552_2518 [Thermodesulfobacteriota bacterium]|nr:hypothetical protein [Thermodesulfobacteriota bacterium]
MVGDITGSQVPRVARDLRLSDVHKDISEFSPVTIRIGYDDSDVCHYLIESFWEEDISHENPDSRDARKRIQDQIGPKARVPVFTLPIHHTPFVS